MSLRTGLLLLPSRPARELAALAARAEALGYDDLWLADERFFRDVYACLAACALATRRIRLATGVTDPYSRHPALTAMAIATLDELILSMFITGPTAVTLPKRMWDAVRLEIDPTIAAASSLIITVAVFVLVGTELLRRRSASIRIPMG